MYIYIGNLSSDATRDDIYKAFQSYGDVTSIDIKVDRKKVCLNGFTIIEMTINDEAKAAVDDLNSLQIAGRTADITEFEHDITLLESDTFNSFLDFIGDTPFTASKEFFSMIKDLEQQDVQWVTRLHEDEQAKVFYQYPTLVEGHKTLTLGPLEASSDWHLASLGAAKVLGVEGFHPNYLKCQVLKTAFPSLPLEFIESDVIGMNVKPDSNVIFCFGVLYHLSEPHIFLRKIRALKPRLIFMGTQLAVDPPHPATERWQLGDIGHLEVDEQTYSGRWYPDYRSEPSNYRAGLDEQPSFWFYPDDLLQLIKDRFIVNDWLVEDRGEWGFNVPLFYPYQEYIPRYRSHGN